MSQAFVREEEGQWLHEVAPTLSALIHFLTRENNGIRVYETRQALNARTGSEEHHMSNGLVYGKDGDGRWMVVG